MIELNDNLININIFSSLFSTKNIQNIKLEKNIKLRSKNSYYVIVLIYWNKNKINEWKKILENKSSKKKFT